MKITYSEYNSEEITKVLDNILDYRDEFCVNTVLKGGQSGYVADEAARRKGHVFTWCANAVMTILTLRFFGGWLFTAGISGIIFGSLLTVIIFKAWEKSAKHLFGPEKIRLGSPATKDHLNSYRVWENREGQVHITDAPEFFGFSKIRVKKNLSEGDMSFIVLADALLDAANRLSWLRGLAIASEELKAFMDTYGEENVAVDMECVPAVFEQAAENDTKTVTLYEYVITLREKAGMAGDTIVPTEYEEKKIRIPFEGGQEIYAKWKEHGILNLGYFDLEYAQMKKSCESIKEAITNRWTEPYYSQNSNVMRDLDKLSSFAEPHASGDGIRPEAKEEAEDESVFRFPGMNDTENDGAAMIAALKDRMKPKG